MKSFIYILSITVLCVSAIDARYSRQVPKNELESSANATINATIADVDDLKAITLIRFPIPFRARTNSTDNLRPCGCVNDFNCGCCTGTRLQQFNIKRQVCYNLTYDPEHYELRLDVKMNNEVLYKNNVQGRNPPPLCMPVPYTPAQMCIKLFNIFTKGRNIHACMDIETKTPDRPLLVLHFDCMRMGQDGFILLKPEDNGGEIASGSPSGGSEVGGAGGDGGGGGGGGGGSGLFGLFINRPKPPTLATTTPATAVAGLATEQPQVDSDIFDPITEIKLKP